MIRDHYKMSHTPGPWKYNNCTVYAGPKATPVAYTGAKFDVHDNSLESLAECHANARLIAAAPELLAALEVCLTETFDRLDPSSTLPSMIRNAIGKAKGV